MPICWIIAGPNGAGKITFALECLLTVAQCRRFINADLIAAGLSPLRVAERVKHGGHNIPAVDIARRFPQSLYNLHYLFSSKVHQTTCFMNHGNVPELVFEQNGLQQQIQHADIFDLLQKRGCTNDYTATTRTRVVNHLKLI